MVFIREKKNPNEKLQRKYVPMNKQKSPKRTNMQTASSWNKKSDTIVFNIAELGACALCTGVMAISPRAQASIW